MLVLSIGLLFEKGKGVKQDYIKAIKWFKKAAKQGYIDARSRLEKYRRMSEKEKKY